MQTGNNARIGYEFEKIVMDIFVNYGIQASIPQQFDNTEYDIEANISNNYFAIEVKIYRDIYANYALTLKAVERIVNISNGENKIPMIVMANLVPQKLEDELKKYGDLVIIDIKNLLYLVDNNEEYRNRLLSILSFTVDDIFPLKPEKLFSYGINPSKKDSLQYKTLIEGVKAWDPNEKNNSGYEKLCYDVLKYLFSNELMLWNDQYKSNDDLFRFDLICKIKDRNRKEFWRMLERYFNTKYLIFEFKNYTNMISQKEIYTTEKYLYLKALRGTAIIISCYGADKNATKAIRGTLRENGKLIICLTNDDLIAMIHKQSRNESPADYLSEILDEMLIDLEK